MNEDFASDWKALGLLDKSPFDILSRPRAEIKPSMAPKKRGPKQKRTQIERVLASLEDKPNHFAVPIMTRAESDRTSAIAGRGMA